MVWSAPTPGFTIKWRRNSPRAWQRRRRFTSCFAFTVRGWMKSIKSISVCGLGKLGACMAATFAERGFEVIGVDIDPEKVRSINQGLPPVEEPLLAETIAAGRSRLRATTDPRETVRTDAT